MPGGWIARTGSGDVGVADGGPRRHVGDGDDCADELDPGGGVPRYADQVTAAAAVSSVSVLPAEMCGYSGQKLMGAWSDTPQQSVEFLDRIVHVWTNTDRLSGRDPRRRRRAGTDGFDAAATVLIEDFGIRIP